MCVLCCGFPLCHVDLIVNRDGSNCQNMQLEVSELQSELANSKQKVMVHRSLCYCCLLALIQPQHHHTQIHHFDSHFLVSGLAVCHLDSQSQSVLIASICVGQAKTLHIF